MNPGIPHPSQAQENAFEDSWQLILPDNINLEDGMLSPKDQEETIPWIVLDKGNLATTGARTILVLADDVTALFKIQSFA